MPAPETSPAKSRWWLEPLIWTVCFVIAIGVAAYVNETAREIVMQGRIEREGDGWVEMEVKQPAPAASQDATKQETVV